MTHESEFLTALSTFHRLTDLPKRLNCYRQFHQRLPLLQLPISLPSMSIDYDEETSHSTGNDIVSDIPPKASHKSFR